MTLQSDEFYIRDVSGKEIAIYSGSSLTQWNIWGLDNIGKINADTTCNYYLKDHLGSIRVVLNSTNSVVSAQDYDCWGYSLENRTYNSSAMKYDFTGKERDDETSYDYFGARYYDSRIGRWGQVEPLLDKNVNFTPYGYSSDNPIVRIDINGKDDYYYLTANSVRIVKTGSDNHNYYVENNLGNIEYQGANYFKANSQQTVDLYEWSQVDTDFENGKFLESFKAAAPKWDVITKALLKDFYAGATSKGGLMDQKEYILNDPSTLYVFKNIVYNMNEAGNIVWGAVMGFLGYSSIEARKIANDAAMILEGRPDETEEQRSINVGNTHFYDNFIELNSEIYGK